MPYQRCISTLGCPEASLPGALDLAASCDLDLVEIRSLGGRVDLPAFLAEQHGSPAQLAAELGERARSIVALDTSLRLLENTAADREAFLEFVPWAETLGVRWLRLFDGGMDITRDLPAAEETFHWWHALKQHHGWRADIMIETHDALLNADSILTLVSACPGIGILWDSHHTWKIGGEAPVDTWRAIRDHVVHIHVKESVSVPSGHHPFSYVLPGAGEFPMSDLQPLLASEFGGAVSLEWERHWHPDLPPVTAALKSAADHRWW